MSSERRLFRKGLLVFVLAACLITLRCTSTPGLDPCHFVPQAGDLLFQDLDGNSFCDAVEKVTQGYKGANLTHVGIAATDADGNLVVLEALPEGVSVTPLDVFLQRSHDAHRRPKVLVGRLRKGYHHLLQPALDEAWALTGKPYDRVFDIHNDAYYCSELVYRSFLAANGGAKTLFELQPMTFVDPATGETFPAWKEYFAELEVPIPEGKPGLNPGGISRSKALRIIHAYGTPSGWKQSRRGSRGTPVFV